MTLVLKEGDMKKILLLLGAILITNAANAKSEYYASVKIGVGDTAIYQDDMKLGDYLVKVVKDFNDGSVYDASGLLLGVSSALGIDWSPNSMYVTQNPYGWFHLRLEAEFGYNNYRQDGKIRHDHEITDAIKIKFNDFFLLANGYADFHIDRVVPYIGLGLGYSFGNQEWTVDGDVYPLHDNGLLYALYAGVGYKYSDITTFELGYSRIYAPAKDDGLYVLGSVRLGARFRI